MAPARAASTQRCCCLCRRRRTPLLDSTGDLGLVAVAEAGDDVETGATRLDAVAVTDMASPAAAAQARGNDTSMPGPASGVGWLVSFFSRALVGQRHQRGSAAARPSGLASTASDCGSFHSARSSSDDALDILSTPRFQGCDHLSDPEKDTMRLLVALVEEDKNWTEHSSSGGTKVERLPRFGGMPGQERMLPVWRVTCTLKQATAKAVFDIIMDADGTPSWHKYVANIKEIKDRRGATGATLLQTCFKGMWPVSPREALELRTSCVESGREASWIAYTSEGIGDPPVPVPPKHERTFTTISGYHIHQPGEAGTVHLTLITHVDAGGNLPDWLLMKVGGEGGKDFMCDIQKELDRRARETRR